MLLWCFSEQEPFVVVCGTMTWSGSWFTSFAIPMCSEHSYFDLHNTPPHTTPFLTKPPFISLLAMLEDCPTFICSRPFPILLYSCLLQAIFKVSVLLVTEMISQLIHRSRVSVENTVLISLKQLQRTVFGRHFPWILPPGEGEVLVDLWLWGHKDSQLCLLISRRCHTSLQQCYPCSKLESLSVLSCPDHTLSKDEWDRVFQL